MQPPLGQEHRAAEMQPWFMEPGFPALPRLLRECTWQRPPLLWASDKPLLLLKYILLKIQTSARSLVLRSSFQVAPSLECMDTVDATTLKVGKCDHFLGVEKKV